ncbi:MAG: DUF1592 domain-containing protein [Verrucomicrobiota bacterium]
MRVIWILSGLLTVAAQAVEIDFEKSVRPVLEAHCYSCHGPDKQKSDVRFDTLSTDLLNDSPAAETWHDALESLNFDEMPPDDEPRLSDDERLALMGWIRQEIDAVVQAKKSTDGRPIIRRLTRREYQNTMTDLLGIDTIYTNSLPPEGLSEDGFQNNGAELGMSALQIEFYLLEARTALEKVIVSNEVPPVYRHEFKQSNAKVNSAANNRDYSNTLGRSQLFLGKIVDEYPEEGRFRVRIRAKGNLIEGEGYPRLQLGIGYTVGSNSPIEVAGAVDVNSEEFRDYEFTGRIEDIPLQSRSQGKYPGMLLRVTNLYDDGTKPKQETIVVTPAEGKKKAKTKKVWLPEPHLPSIEIESVEFVGPVFDSWPPEHHTDILFTSDLRNTDERAYAKEVLQRFLRRAFRRPVEESEVGLYLRLFDHARPTKDSFEAAIREPLAMALISPDFLYLLEPSSSEKRPLNDWELASRLSYFLWGTMPDENLLAAAGEGQLTKPEFLKKQVARMLEDERSWEFIDQFVDQWLDISAVDRVAVNPEFYPEWNDDLKPSIREETKHFFAEILHQRLSALNFLDSEFAMLNRPLAQHYGLDVTPRGMEFERVSLPESSERGGLLTQASVLLGHSTGADSHPVLRAVWLRDRLLNDPPGNPPPNVPELDSENPDFAKLPVREQLEIHREQAACNDCHRSIDPWGIAFEGFGADGLVRTEILRHDPKKKNKTFKQPVKTAATLPGGAEINGIEELKAYLLDQRREQFSRALVSKLLTYALGRSLELTDQDTVDELTEEFVRSDFQLHWLMQEVVASEAFLSK